MGWCLECHRSPNSQLRPLEYITSMTWTPPTDPQEAAALGEKLAKDYKKRDAQKNAEHDLWSGA